MADINRGRKLPTDFDPGEGLVRVARGKGGRARLDRLPFEGRGLLRRLARKAGESLALIQAQLGHRSSPVTTSRYLHRLAPEALVQAIRGRPAWSD